MAEPPPMPSLEAMGETVAARDPELPRDLKDGLRFVHVMEAQARRDLTELTANIEALAEEMEAAGLIDAEKYAERADRIRREEITRMDAHQRVFLEPSLDKYTMKGLPDIDCGALIPLCRGRCCTLYFPLSKQDLAERAVKWDYAQPYIIRQGESGYCVHNDPETKFCTVYEKRPAVCRFYDCRKDKRIWLDFDKRIPAVDPALTPKQAPTPHGPPPDVVVIEADPL